jgi:hypothetical protein
MAKDIDQRLRRFEDALVNVLANVDDKLYSKLRKCRPGDATYCALSSAPNLYIKEVCVHPGNPLDARPGRIT